MDGFRQKPARTAKELGNEIDLLHQGMNKLADNDRMVYNHVAQASQATAVRLQEFGSSLNMVAFNLKCLVDFLDSKGILVKSELTAYIEQSTKTLLEDIEKADDEKNGVVLVDAPVARGNVVCVNITDAKDLVTKEEVQQLELRNVIAYIPVEGEGESNLPYGKLLDGLDSAILGLKAGESKTIDIFTLPSDFFIEEFRDKKVSLKIEVIKVKAKVA